MALIVLTLITTTGCSDNSPIATAPSQRPAVNLVGAWNGTTAQGKPVTFQVATTLGGAAITSLFVDFLTGDVNCPEEGFLATPSSPVAIANNQFTFSFGGLATISGTFSSPISGSGDASLTMSGGQCGGTVPTAWTATKQ
jgi:hypothetical protein